MRNFRFKRFISHGKNRESICHEVVQKVVPKKKREIK